MWPVGVVVELCQVRQIDLIYQVYCMQLFVGNSSTASAPLRVMYTSMLKGASNISAPCAKNVYMGHNILMNWKAVHVQSTARLHDTLGHTHSILYITKHANLAHAAHNFMVGSPYSSISLALSEQF